MNRKQRVEMLQRFSDTDRWLSRVYDTNRSPEHRLGIWNFLMQHTNPKLKHLLIITRQIDEQQVEFWSDPNHRN